MKSVRFQRAKGEGNLECEVPENELWSCHLVARDRGLFKNMQGVPIVAQLIKDPVLFL